MLIHEIRSEQSIARGKIISNNISNLKISNPLLTLNNSESQEKYSHYFQWLVKIALC